MKNFTIRLALALIGACAIYIVIPTAWMQSIQPATSGSDSSPSGFSFFPSAVAVGVTSNNRLLRFDINFPNDTTEISTLSTANGLQTAGEIVVDIDLRPATNQLYILTREPTTNTGRLYTINPANGAASFIVALDVALNGSDFGIDFNPTVDRLRIVSNTLQNLRVNPDTGVTIVDGQLAFDVDTDGDGSDTGDVNSGVTPDSS
ncbi:MAG: DUF4394 domain-containing protein [Pyrinomonadaceae bacterium MAG19_C2-C3]|nr:DUF4394 domain-containing protein [Pyrinomonadaceae bacterium MAG19_C2-C3]